MPGEKPISERIASFHADDILLPVKVVFRGIGQVFFQENALTARRAWERQRERYEGRRQAKEK